MTKILKAIGSAVTTVYRTHLSHDAYKARPTPPPPPPITWREAIAATASWILQIAILIAIMTFVATHENYIERKLDGFMETSEFNFTQFKARIDGVVDCIADENRCY